MDPVKSSDSSFKLCGSWKLVSLSGQGKNGHSIHPMGTDAQGRLIYEPDGRMMMQVMRSNRPQLSADDPLFASEEDLRAAFSGYLAYFGTYTFNEVEQVIVHHIEAHSIPNWVGADYVRHFECDGKHLTLKGPFTLSGMEGELIMVWERLL